MQGSDLKKAHMQVSASSIQQLGLVIDHLVDALGGDPSCPIRRAITLVDIDAHPGTTQTEMMARLGLDKSTLNRDMDWLRSHACIRRNAGEEDARVFHMITYGYSKKNLVLALNFFQNSHKKLITLLEAFINVLDRRASLRDAKLLIAVSERGQASKRELFSRTYEGAETTKLRSLQELVDAGLIKKTGTDGS